MKSFLDKFAVGRIFAIPDANPLIAHATPTTPNGFQTVIDPPGHLGHSQGKFGHKDRVSDFKTGNSGDAHRNFLWLPYIPGFVSEIEQTGNLPVMTGPLSGCPVTRYLRQGKVYVGHVGTSNNATDQQTIDAKRYWNAFVQTVPVHSRSGCNVLRDLTSMGQLNHLAAMGAGDGAIKFWAIVLPNGDFYGMAAYSQFNDQNKKRPIAVPQGGTGGTAWWRVALAPVKITNTAWPSNGIMT